MPVINRATVRDLRPVIENAINEKLEKIGLRASLGRITFEPGSNFRGKLVVHEIRTKTTLNARPQIGEMWVFGRHKYQIDADNLDTLTVSRPSRSSRGFWCHKRNCMVASYRVKTADMIAQGIKA